MDSASYDHFIDFEGLERESVIAVGYISFDSEIPASYDVEVVGLNVVTFASDESDASLSCRHVVDVEVGPTRLDCVGEDEGRGRHID